MEVCEENKSMQKENSSTSLNLIGSAALTGALPRTEPLSNGETSSLSTTVSEVDRPMKDDVTKEDSPPPQQQEAEYTLLKAAEEFNIPKIEEILEKENSANMTDDEGNNAVHIMLLTYVTLDLVEQMHAKPKYLEILGILLRKGFDINSTDLQKQTALHHIVSFPNYPDIIKPLLASGIKINAKDKKGNTALHVAIIKGNSTNAQTLVEGGADPNLGDSEGRTALHMLAQGRRNLTLLQHLLKCGADPKATDHGGRTPLHLAAKKGRVEIMRELMLCGASANALDNSGQAPLHFAIKGDMTGQAAQLLLQHKAQPDFQDDVTGETAMHKAVKLGMVNSIEELMKFAPNLNLKNITGETVLHTAANCKDIHIWDMLLRNGGDMGVTNLAGFTPLQKAMKAKNQVALTLMREHDTSYSVAY